MLNRNLFFWAVLPTVSVLSACSIIPKFVSHSDPLTPEQHMQLGSVYMAQGLNESAGEQFEAAIRLEKGYVPGHIASGNLAFANGELKKAEASYLRVLRLDLNHAGAHNNLAMIALAHGKNLEKAEQYAQKALKQGGPLEPFVLETLASIYIQQGRFDEARKVLNEADELTPSSNKALCDQLIKTRERLVLSQ